MKLLYYNWVQFDDKKNTGGGVTIYLRNVIDYLIKNTKHEIYFLSAGFKYNPFRKKYYIKRTKNIYGDACKSFEIINSPIIAPAFATFMNVDKYIDDLESVNIFDDFISKYGPFDVIHINNFEGISENILNLKEKYPNTKFIFSVHNYIPICPLAQYFQNHKNVICNNFNDGKECLNCPSSRPSKRDYYRCCKKYITEVLTGWKNIFKPLILLILKLLKFRSKDYIGYKTNIKPEKYVEYRKSNIEKLNKYADCILAVSERVRQIMIKNGTNPDKIITSYIGTKFADKEMRCSIAQIVKPFTIAYLGYERIDKGFFFLIESLSKLDNDLANKINVVLAVKDIHKENYEEKLKKFNKVIVHNGYTHENLSEILKEVNLGVVPVLWEDNLPQVAIEMVANGVPILCSDFGGASELCSSDLFKFKGGNEDDFIRALVSFVENNVDVNAYWKFHNGLKTMKEHITELEGLYKK